MTRGLYLRSYLVLKKGFDRQITKMILDDMQLINQAKIVHYALPYEILEKENGKLLVKWHDYQKNNESFEDGIFCI
jgi:hypothetical protein